MTFPCVSGTFSVKHQGRCTTIDNNTVVDFYDKTYRDHDGEYAEDYYNNLSTESEDECLEWCFNKTQTYGRKEWTKFHACEYSEDNEACWLYGGNDLPVTGGNGVEYYVCWAYGKYFRIHQISLLV